ncbi:MAG: GTPase HflX [Candidatus Marinimicrobia bacterium]|nr:GTPase HflX [Candidatus Neomarinimicrobiota bacterium]
MLEKQIFPKKAILVSAAVGPEEKEDLEEHQQELKMLVQTLKMQVLDTFQVVLKSITPATFIGSGKVQEIKETVELLDAKIVVFDNDLKPSQERNLEEMWGNVVVTTRTGIILEVFRRHARTREAKTQVELARLEYLSTRLVGMWSHLSRQDGSVGVRGGPGEKQVEIDRRIVNDRIAKLKEKLAKIEQQKEVQSSQRQQEFRVAIVGYTNAGKSTLMKAMTQEEVLVQDQLFATLDTTVRKCELDSSHTILLSDTVGFIRKLPHRLVASFKSTLKEAREADLILKVTDLSSDYWKEHLHTVETILEELDAHKIPSMIICNKIDKCDNSDFQKVKHNYPDAIFISAIDHIGIDNLKKKILDFLHEKEVRIKLTIPADNMKSIVALRKYGTIETEEYENSQAFIDIVCYQNIWNKLKDQLTDNIEVKSVEKVSG